MFDLPAEKKWQLYQSKKKVLKMLAVYLIYYILQILDVLDRYCYGCSY